MDNTEKEFERLVQAHKDVIYTACYMFSKDADEVADLFQETLVNMWKGVLKSSSHMLTAAREAQKAWVYRVALNTCISSDRKKRKHPTVSLNMDINLFADSDNCSHQTNMLHRRITRLQPFDRAIVLLWLEDISYEEIGSIMGISPKNVSVRLVRIKEELKKNNNQ